MAAGTPSATAETPSGHSTGSDMPESAMTEMAEDEHGHGGEGEHAFSFGQPAEASEADRTVAIEASDEMAFDPDDVDVQAGEVITFEVTNAGKIPHDFTLGDEAAQEEHEREMAEAMGSEMEMAHDEPNAMTVPPGETRTLTWRFSEPGTVLYGCHQPGHYEAGMVGAVVVPR